MGNFNRDNRSGKGRSFGGKREFGSGTDRPTLHKAICSKCGKECEVPFKPTGSKPVFCRDCFRDNGGADSRRSDSRSFGRSRSDDRPMFDAVCAECGNNCKVPFQPGEGKQVLCSECFEKKGGDPRRANNIMRNTAPSYKEELDMLNAKLDKILKILTPAVLVKEEAPVVQEEKIAEEVKILQPEEQAVIPAKKKRTSKKTTPAPEEQL